MSQVAILNVANASFNVIAKRKFREKFRIYGNV